MLSHQHAFRMPERLGAEVPCYDDTSVLLHVNGSSADQAIQEIEPVAVCSTSSERQSASLMPCSMPLMLLVHVRIGIKWVCS